MSGPDPGQSEGAAAPPPRLSIIIPTHNRRDLLRRCLEYLGHQELDPAEFEVIVADDGSSDGTAEMVEGLKTAYGLSVLRLEKCGKPAARNAGIKRARGEVCLFLDDDVIASPS